jgi:hypothetical protein
MHFQYGLVFLTKEADGRNFYAAYDSIWIVIIIGANDPPKMVKIYTFRVYSVSVT